MMSIISFIWAFMTFWVSFGALIVTYPNLTPAFIAHMYLYGKIRSTKSHDLTAESKLLLPKSAFSHFYLAGIISFFIVLCLTIYSNFIIGEWPSAVLDAVQMLRYPTVESYSGLFTSMIVMCMADFQVTRRFLECLFVSVYSEGGKMSIVIYIVGVAFYVGLAVTCLVGTDLTDVVLFTDIPSSFRLHHIAGLLLFFYASWKQNRIAHMFAKLRQNKDGTVENTKHHIPHGDLFEYVSCPHYFCEILIYLSMNIVYWWSNTMMTWLFVFVLANQIISGYFTHKWYKENFPKYPKERKAVIPYLI